MTGPYLLTGVTIVAVVLAAIALLRWLAGRAWRYLWLAVFGLPLSAIVNLLVKAPLVIGFANLTGIPYTDKLLQPWWYLLVLLLITAIPEESIKLLPLALPWPRRHLTGPREALYTGLALGIGFGLGEALYLAFQLSQVPAYAGVPWNAYFGFAIERFEATFIHGLMTAVVVLGLQRGGWKILWGFLGGVAMHALVDSVALAYQYGKVSVQVAFFWTPFILIVFFILFLALRRLEKPPAHLDEPTLEES